MQELLKSQDDCVLITSPSNLYYFTDYQNSDAVLAYEGGVRHYFTDERYFEEASKIANADIQNIENLKKFIEDRKGKAFGLEGKLNMIDFMRYNEWGVKDYYLVDDKLNAMRAVKKPHEIDRIIRAQGITDAAFKNVLPKIRVGMTEKQLKAIIECEVLNLGGDGMAFETIVAFGADCSKPHAHAGDKKLKKGELITMDFGAKFNGYCSDMTRMAAAGKLDARMLDTYAKVKAAQELCLKHITAGKTGKECDAIARDYFQGFELGKFFSHSLGHSLGIDIHENPRFSPKSNAIITEGMVLSVEPGLYFAGEYGVRIEDIVYFDKSGLKNLTKSPKELIIV